MNISTRKPTVDDILKEIPWIDKVNYFVAGSVQYGGATDKSDLDIVIPIMDSSDVAQEIKTRGYEIEHSHYSNGFKFYQGGIVFNIIPLHPNDFCAWNAVARMVKASGIFAKGLEKVRLYAIHEGLVALCKLSFKEEINVNNFMQYWDLGGLVHPKVEVADIHVIPEPTDPDLPW